MEKQFSKIEQALSKYNLNVDDAQVREAVKKIIAEQGRLGDLAGTVLRRKTANFVIDNIAK